MVRSASVRRIHPAAFLFLALLVGGTPASAVETVTPMKDPDGEWRVSGYFIK